MKQILAKLLLTIVYVFGWMLDFVVTLTLIIPCAILNKLTVRQWRIKKNILLEELALLTAIAGVYMVWKDPVNLDTTRYRYEELRDTIRKEDAIIGLNCNTFKYLCLKYDDTEDDGA